MTELSARLSLYGAIDRAVVEGDRLQAAAAVLPLHRYDLHHHLHGDDRDESLVGTARRDGTRGWHSQLRGILPKVDVSPLEVPLEHALHELQALEAPSPLDQARRLKVAWAATRVLDVDRDLIAGMLAPLAHAALAEHGPPPGSGPDAVRLHSDLLETNLVDLVVDPEGFTTAEEWPGLVDEAARRGLISSAVAELAAIGCEDEITFVPGADGDDVLVARIVSSVRGFDVGTRTLAQIEAALQPGNWSRGLPGFWCEMRRVQVPPTLAWAVYQEVVGECPTVWFDPYLRFATIEHRDDNGDPNGFELQYDLCPPDELDHLSKGRPAPLAQDDRIEVDSGKIIVAFRPKADGPTDHGEIDITASKNIRFREPLPTGGVASLACISGWAEQTRTMMAGLTT